jgi:hypothetical protein
LIDQHGNLDSILAILGARELLFASNWIMNAFFSPWKLGAACALTIVGLLASPNGALWVACLLALPIAVWLLGGKQAYRVLAWVIAVNWLQIAGTVVAADLSGKTISVGYFGTYNVDAIIYSLCALLLLAFGMRLGTQLGGRLFRLSVRRTCGSPAGDTHRIRQRRLMLTYLVSLGASQTVGHVAYSVPGLTQPILVLGSIKFVCVYLVTLTVLESNRGYGWLAAMSVLETTTGLVGYFADYKDAFIVMLIALASSRRPMGARMWVFGTTALVGVVWLSLGWTAIKQEYRESVVRNPIEVRLEWIAQRFSGGINYGKAAVKLVQRIGYTDFYADVIAREEAGSLRRDFDYYASAVQLVLTPRFLFPDKEALDDSKKTTALLGIKIPNDTSISVGYVAEAHVDFGFPLLLVPILSIGLMIGGAAKYFMTRAAPLQIREAFTTATLFRVFAYEANIDKALGGFILSFLVMALVLKFAYPMIARWLVGSRVERHDYCEVAVVDMHSRRPS